MSYLLTEIALEMLGYKFYDTEGILGATNFQNSSQLPHTHSISDEKRKEESLNVLLNLIPIANSQQNQEGTSSTPVDLLNHPEEGAAACIDADSSSTIADEILPPQSRENAKPLQSTKRILPNALSKLLDNECERIQHQILRNKNVFIQTYTEINKMNDQRGNVCDSLALFKEQEKINLKNELQTMHIFRKLVERSLYKVRSDNYEKYKKIFLPSTEDTIPIDVDNI